MVLVRALAALVALRTASARTVEWHGIDATIKGRSLLRSISGRAEPGRLHAIMGPSGSGKSTLLCAIAGCCDRKVGLRGDLRLDGAAVDRVDAAFVRQQGVFYPSAAWRRKRLAIACELVDDPAVLFLDEPTSGLDSFAAARVVASLRGLCDAGTTVVCVIHQPSGKVFDAFDDLTLLSEGELMYHGPRRGVDRALARQGAKRPAFSSAAEHARRDVSRAKAATAIKAAQQVMTALIYGGIYDLDDSQRSIQDRFGLLSLCVIGSTNLAIASTIRAFPKEKAIVVRERAPRSGRPMYGAFPYLASKVAAELPLAAGLSCLFGAVLYPLAKLRRSAQAFRTFLGIQVLNSLASGALGLLVGAVAPSTDAALALFPPLIVLMIIFNGSNISDESTPRPIKFLPKLSLVRWGFEGLAVNEFDGLYFECQNRREDLRTGRDALARLAFEDSTVKKACVAQAAILGGCYLQTYRARSAPRGPPSPS
ncbi:ATPase [Aureococcus anophagefferens]|nr:ATPase [Aureococcus anophagefferens]